MEGDFQTCLHCTGYDETMELLEGSFNRNTWSAGLSTGSTVVTGTAGVLATLATNGLALPVAFDVGDRMAKRAKRKMAKRKLLRKHINLIRAARSVTGCRCVQYSTPHAACGQIELHTLDGG